MLHRFSPALGLVACLHLAGPAFSAGPAPMAQESGQSRGSLQGLLERLRKDYASRSASLSAKVQAELEQIEALAGRNLDSALARRKKALLALGPSAAPLLVPALDPKDEKDKAKLRRARLVAEVLKQSPYPSITDALLVSASTGTLTGRLLALEVLATSLEPARVAPVVGALYKRSSGPIQRRSLVTLSMLGGEQAQRMIDEALNDDDLALATVALDALTATQNLSVQERVLALAASERGTALVSPLLRYFAAVPAALESEQAVDVMLELALNRQLLTGQRISIFDHLCEREELDLSRATRKSLDPTTNSVRRDVAESCLAMLARHGDKRARKKLLTSYDDKVRRQPDYSAVYADRALMLERIGSWSDAVSDFKKAIKRARRGERDPETYSGIARCLARLKKYKDAAKYLADSPLSYSQLRELAKHKAFTAMLKSKHRAAFHLGDER